MNIYEHDLKLSNFFVKWTCRVIRASVCRVRGSRRVTVTRRLCRFPIQTPWTHECLVFDYGLYRVWIGPRWTKLRRINWRAEVSRTELIYILEITTRHRITKTVSWILLCVHIYFFYNFICYLPRLTPPPSSSSPLAESSN